MADFYGTQSATLRDQRGFLATVKVTVHSTVSEAALLADASSFVTYLQAASEGQLVRTAGLYLATFSPGYGSTGGYPDVAQRCDLFGFTPSGNKTKLSIPMPLTDCFLADQVTADLGTNAGIAGIVAMAAGGTLVQNKTLSTFVINAGFFRDDRRKRRIIAGIKDPTMTGPA